MKPDQTPAAGGTLYVVGTPIGNLQDVTTRMKEVLGTVALVAAEDTRRTRNLLTHLGISAKLISCHEHNEASASAKIVEHLSRSDDVALVSDAGTPVLSDPGRRVVLLVREHGFRIVPIPGPSAVTTALSVSGMSGDQFFFQGFLPAKKGARKKKLEELSRMECTLVFFEAPHRLAATLTDMMSHLGDRETFMARELTKLHETLFSGRISELLSHVKEHGVKGEITLLVQGAVPSSADLSLQMEDEIQQLIRSLVLCESLPTKSVTSLLSSVTGISKNRLYTLALQVMKDKGGQSAD